MKRPDSTLNVMPTAPEDTCCWPNPCRDGMAELGAELGAELVAASRYGRTRETRMPRWAPGAFDLLRRDCAGQAKRQSGLTCRKQSEQ
jgi:hypothetical protein